MSHHTDMQKYKESPVFAVKHWRNTPQETETALEDFLFWMEYDQENDIDMSELEYIKELVDEFLGRDPKKIEKGEKELMQAWIKACK